MDTVPLYLVAATAGFIQNLKMEPRSLFSRNELIFYSVGVWADSLEIAGETAGQKLRTKKDSEAQKRAKSKDLWEIAT